MRFVILIVIVMLAVAAGLGMLWVSGGTQRPEAQKTQQASTAQVPTADILVAREDIPLGSVITDAMVDRQPWPRNLVLEGFIHADDKNTPVVGSVARADFKAREPLIAAKLTRPDDASFLAGTLGQGMRAVTVAVDPISGVAGYIFPGDRVDVLLTHSVPQEAAAQLFGSGSAGFGKPTTSEVLLADIRILAVNTRKAPPKQDAPPQVDPPSNVTLEISQEDAKKMRLAERNGTLSLALRSLKDKDEGSVGLPVTVVDISRVEGGLGDLKGWGWRKPGSALGSYSEDVVIIRGVVADRPINSQVQVGPPMVSSGYGAAPVPANAP